MSTPVIQTRGLRKEFRPGTRTRLAVAGLDLDVPAQGVHGFLGPNGSGKTTTIRMLLGLASATSGEMSLFGQQVPDQLPAVMDRVGAVVESPKFSPTFTGHQNLALLAGTIGRSTDVVEESLAKVGLHERGQDRYGSYSLGMKQRLAIAATLLKKPDLLILDEPTNGLDPAGIREIRDLIKQLGSSGVTVLLSSHILAEVQQVCDSVTIIGNGRRLASGSVSDLIGSAGSYRVTVTDRSAALAALTAAGLTASDDESGLIVQTEGDPSEITRVLADANIYLSELSALRADLESVYLELTAQDRMGAMPSEEDYR